MALLTLHFKMCSILLARGRTSNFLSIHRIAHVTLNADGTMTSSVNNFSTTCH